MMQIIDGKKLRDDILLKVKREVASLGFQPIFCDILVGDDLASAQYVQIKAKTAEAVGIKFLNVHLKESINEDELIGEINKINELPNICGLIVQLPLPKQIDKQKILDAVLPVIDVDCLSKTTSDLFYQNKNTLSFPTALACVHVLNSLNIEIKNKKIVILGEGMLVGRPVAHILRNKGFDIATVNSNTENTFKNNLIKNADIIISAIGQSKFLKGDMIKDGAIIIDAGTSEEGGGIVGDVDLESMNNKAGFISPVPGGVGPVTVAMLLDNVLQVAKSLDFARDKNKNYE